MALLFFLRLLTLPALVLVSLSLAPTSAESFSATLKHADSGKNFTRLQKLEHATLRDRRDRLKLLMGGALGQPSTGPPIEATVYFGEGSFVMEFAIGTPPINVSGILDTGSDLMWFRKCQPSNTSHTFSKLGCCDRLCKAMEFSNCTHNGCEYLQRYGSRPAVNVYTRGTMARETFTFIGDDSMQNWHRRVISVIHNVAFGCSSSSKGFEDFEGLVGLGYGPLSLVSQLDEPKFSYCLPIIEDDNAMGRIFMGPLAHSAILSCPKQKVVSTRMIQHPNHTYYYISFRGISVAKHRIVTSSSAFEIQPNGTGGVMIDSGTTLTYFKDEVFDKVKAAFLSHTTLSVSNVSVPGYDVCFNPPQHSNRSPSHMTTVPKLVFHFDNGDLELPVENYMVPDYLDLGLLCLAMGRTPAPFSVLGHVTQQNMVVLYDREKAMLSIAPTNCKRWM